MADSGETLGSKTREESHHRAHEPKPAVKSSVKLSTAFDAGFRLIHFFFKDRVSCSSHQAQTCYTAKKDGFDLPILLPPPTERWHHRFPPGFILVSQAHTTTLLCLWGTGDQIQGSAHASKNSELYLIDIHFKTVYCVYLFLSMCACPCTQRSEDNVGSGD